MLAGLGLHPFFPKQHLARLSCSFEGRWRCNPEGLPSRFLELGESDQFDGSATMKEFDLDDIYTGLTKDIDLRWESKKYGLKFVSSDEIFGCVIYSPVEQDYFCVEPITHLPNVINKHEQAGTIRKLEAGGSMSICHTFICSEN